MEIWERRQYGGSLVGPQLHYWRVRSNKGVPVLEAPEKEHCRGQVGSKPIQLSNHPGSQGQNPLCCPHPGSPACGLTVDMPKIWARGFCSTAQGSCRPKGALDPRQGRAPTPVPGLKAG